MSKWNFIEIVGQPKSGGSYWLAHITNQGIKAVRKCWWDGRQWTGQIDIPPGLLMEAMGYKVIAWMEIAKAVSPDFPTEADREPFEPFRRFWLFAGDSTYPGGGMFDFIGSHDSLGQAMEHVGSEWAHVFDQQTGLVVKTRDAGPWRDPHDGEFAHMERFQ